MTATLAQILEQALALPENERSAIAHALFDSLSPSSLDDGSQETIDAAWEVEIQRRIDDIDSGRVKMIPWQEARQRLLTRVGRVS